MPRDVSGVRDVSVSCMAGFLVVEIFLYTQIHAPYSCTEMTL